jgi:molybdenum cofactor biosynthesis protein B
MAYDEHVRSASDIAARCAVITLSDTRTESNDDSGQAIQRLLREAGHRVRSYRVIKDDPDDLRIVLEESLTQADVDVVLTNGGTGISPRDQTIKVIEEMIDVRLPGFGELFRMLSFEQIGSGAMLSRAEAGIARGKPVFAMPGSTKAVELAMARLIVPEIRHMLGQLRRQVRD